MAQKVVEAQKWSFPPLRDRNLQEFIIGIMQQRDFQLQYGREPQAELVARLGLGKYGNLEDKKQQEAFAGDFIRAAKELFPRFGLDPALLGQYRLEFIENEQAGDMMMNGFKKVIGINLANAPRRAIPKQNPGVELPEEAYQMFDELHIARLLEEIVHEGAHMDYHELHKGHISELGESEADADPRMVFSKGLREPESVEGRAIGYLAFDEARAGAWELAASRIENGFCLAFMTGQVSNIASAIGAEGKSLDELWNGIDVGELELKEAGVKMNSPLPQKLVLDPGTLVSHSFGMLGQWYFSRLEVAGLDPLEVFKKLSAPEGLMPYLSMDGKLGFREHSGGEESARDAREVIRSIFQKEEAENVIRIFVG